jgi:hypothetical protein
MRQSHPVNFPPLGAADEVHRRQGNDWSRLAQRNQRASGRSARQPRHLNGSMLMRWWGAKSPGYGLNHGRLAGDASPRNLSRPRSPGDVAKIFAVQIMRQPTVQYFLPKFIGSSIIRVPSQSCGKHNNSILFNKSSFFIEFRPTTPYRLIAY